LVQPFKLLWGENRDTQAVWKIAYTYFDFVKIREVNGKMKEVTNLTLCEDDSPISACSV
jgi:hypothetical protein